MSLETGKHFEYLESFFKQQIWLTPLSSFNDPFEGRFKLISFTSRTILSKPEMLDQYLELQRQHGEPDLTREAFISRLESGQFQDALIANSPSVHDLFQSHGAICLTLDPKNIPMWAYYGNNHKGCCLKFELDFQLIQNETGMTDLPYYAEEVENGNTLISFHLPKTDYEFVLSKVQYEEEMPTIDLNEVIKLKTTIEQTKYLVSRSVGVKYRQWGHEHEYRLIANTNSVIQDNLSLPLKIIAPFLSITGIITGSNMDNDTIERVKKMANQYKMSLSKASCSPEGYKIEISEDHTHVQPVNIYLEPEAI